MLGFFNTCFSQSRLDEMIELSKIEHAPNFVCRDDLSKNKPAVLIKRKDERKEWCEKRSHGNGGEKGVKVRVKMVMTKQEAARLLSKCNNKGGILEFKDVAREIVNIPSSRVSVVSHGASCNKALEAIPEED